MIKKLGFAFVFCVVFFQAVGFKPLVKTQKYSDSYHSEKSFTFASSKDIVVGEDLTYVVKYLGLKLGEVRLIVKNKTLIDNVSYYETIAYINSYPSIPLVDLHQIYESTIHPEMYSKFFRGTVQSKEDTSFTEYYFDYPKNSVRMVRGSNYKKLFYFDRTERIDRTVQDGLSIFYFARMGFGRYTSYNIPSFVNEKLAYASINFRDKVEDVSIDAVNYDVATKKVDGHINFISIWGLQGDYEGWFSDDNASIPILAKLSVIIGNVKLELIRWNRPGWNPPRYK